MKEVAAVVRLAPAQSVEMSMTSFDAAGVPDPVSVTVIGSESVTWYQA